MSDFRSPPKRDVAETRPGPRLRRGAKAVVSSSSRVLLVRERHSDGRPFWTLPGGGVHPEESLIEGLRRELVEELCCVPVVGRPTSTFWYAHHRPRDVVSHYTVFRCSVPGAVRPVKGEGILAARWVAPDRPPAGTLPQVRHLLAKTGSTAE
ncbi:NUDIX hydrolase [Haloplanus sp.]|uniref:NUDIX hydrolase n=1 Tax=Haloplanus sp. TaxID=1961696 RepID=UPI0026309105|nr:NUDIX domain-containing protein [Haloplanus sp.]